MKLNVAAKTAPVFTHEGARAVKINAEKELARSVMACMLWEDTFYESGEEISARIGKLIPSVRPEFAAAVAAHARWDMKLRHAPLLVVREMARYPKHKALVGRLLPDVIGRPDEITEFLAIYWKDKADQPLSAQVKKGLAAAFRKFNEFELAKYDRDGPVKLRDVLFLTHAKPEDGRKGYTKEARRAKKRVVLKPGEKLYKAIVDRTLQTPDTWETQLSAGADKKETFERLIRERKLGALAFLRNLRNMAEAKVDVKLIESYMATVNLGRVLPFRFITAARYAPQWEPMLEQAMFRCLEGGEKLSGKTAIVVDNSGSMYGSKVSRRSELDRSDAACALAILVREVCEDAVVIGFGSGARVIPARRGFALRDAIKNGPGGGTDTAGALLLAARQGYDRVIVITDEQSHTRISVPAKGAKGYFINVATYQNGIGYGAWTHIDGWSEAVLDYIREAEKE